MDIRVIPVKDIVGWGENPRTLDDGDYIRLKRQIRSLGIYKPILVTRALPSDNVDASYITIGGNQRLAVFKHLGIKSVECSVISADTKDERVKYSLSDNSHAGRWDEGMLAEQIKDVEFDTDMFKVDLGKMVKLDELLKDVEVPEIETPQKKVNECPSCGYQF